MTTSQLCPAITIVQGRPAVSSRDIANHFDKRHAHVIRSIQSVIRNCPESFSQPNFGLAEYADAQGKMRPFFHLTRQGFAAVAMGFTGAKAIKWRIAYIQAFEAMEAKLLGRSARASGRHAPRTTGAQRKPLAVAVNRIVGLDEQGPNPNKYKKFWKALDAVLGINSIEQLTVDRLPAVQAFLDMLVQMMDSRPTQQPLPSSQAQALGAKDKIANMLAAVERAHELCHDMLWETADAILGFTNESNLCVGGRHE